jgi:putative membrane protein
MRNDHQKDGDIWKGLAAGMIGGLAASWIMNQFQAALAKRIAGREKPHGAQSLQDGSPQHGVGRKLQERGSEEQDDNATERMASLVSEEVFAHRLSEDEKERGGVIAHYAMGVTSGVMYGAAAELLPQVTAGAGLPFGAAVWVIADEGIVPALGLSKSPTEYPLSKHTYAFVSHLVFGLSAEVVRNAVRRLL